MTLGRQDEHTLNKSTAGPTKAKKLEERSLKGVYTVIPHMSKRMLKPFPEVYPHVFPKKQQLITFHDTNGIAEELIKDHICLS